LYRYSGEVTIRKILDRSGEVRSEETYLENFNLATPSLTPGGRSRRSKVGRRSVIVDDIIFIDLGIKKKTPT
jgi:hypothetical protein